MGESGHKVFCALLRAENERFDKRFDERDRFVAALSRVQSEVGRHLIVARARRVQLFARLPDSFYEIFFHEGMNIFRVFDFKRAAPNIA